jgi:hypothetical protein
MNAVLWAEPLPGLPVLQVVVLGGSGAEGRVSDGLEEAVPLGFQPVSWRKTASITIGLLLPLPLMFAIGLIGRPDHEASIPQDRLISPVLSRAERGKLPSFQRACRRSEDCDPPLACLNIDGGGTSSCVDSECLNDAQCSEGFICRLLGSRDDGPLVRTCVPQGSVPEGTLCVEAPANRQGACQPGLICAGWCGRPCRLGGPSTCAPGSFCADSLNGSLCLPSCTADSCPPGHQCILSNGAVSFCSIVVGENCQRSACPDGRKCNYSYAPGQNRVRMECIIPCDDQVSPCPAGPLLCFAGACRRPCDRAGSATCGPNERCVELPVEKRSLCLSRSD